MICINDKFIGQLLLQGEHYIRYLGLSHKTIGFSFSLCLLGLITKYVITLDFLMKTIWMIKCSYTLKNSGVSLFALSVHALRSLRMLGCHPC